MAKPKSHDLSTALDSRLKRAISSMKIKSRLQQDLEWGLATAAAVGAPTAATITRRVLVSLAEDKVPSDLAGWGWTRVVERVYAVDVPIDQMKTLGERPEVRFVEAGRPMMPMLSSSVAETRTDRVWKTPFNLRGTGVVVGIIDVGGFDFTLDDFRDAAGKTRVAFLWDQNLVPVGTESRPANFTYGVEYDAQAIDAALTQSNPFTRVRHKVEAASHATHVASTAVGNGRSSDAAYPAGTFIGTAPEATLILVSPSVEEEAGSFTDSVHVAEAVAYIFGKAHEMGLPCVINMSLGQNGGSHDGESVVERAIDRLLDMPGRCFVAAAGNEHVFRGHASGTLAVGSSRNLRWRTGGGLPWPGFGNLPAGPFGDRTPNEMEIWHSPADIIRVTLTSPAGESVGPVEAGDTISQTLATGEQVFIDAVRFSPLNGDSLVYIEVSPELGGTVATGEWTVTLEPLAVRFGRFDAWIERDARIGSNNFSDQSFFVGTDFDPVMTLGTPATGRRSVVVANYSHVAQSVADSSSRGGTRDGRFKPEVAAPGTAIVAAHSLGGRPAPNGAAYPMRVAMTGTSMAAPHVAGIIALMLQRNPRLTSAQIQKILVATARADTAAFDSAWGFGRIDAEEAIAQA